MKIQQDALEIGTKVYRYRIDSDNGVYSLREKVGKVVKYIVDNHGLPWDRGKKIAFDPGDPIYICKYKEGIPFDECVGNRVLLLEDNPQKAMELFIKFEEDKIAELYAEIDMRKDKIVKLREKVCSSLS